MVHFSTAQALLSAGLIFLAVAIPVWVLYLVGRRIPPALERRGRKSGFSGSLVLLDAAFVFFFLYWVLFAAIDAAQASRFLTYRVDVPAWQILAPLIPDVVFVALFGWVAVRLALVRRSRVQAEAIAVVWALGPLAGIAEGLIYKGAVDWQGLAFSAAFAAVATIYLLLSDRVNLTYGTRRGRTLPELDPPGSRARRAGGK